MSGFPADLEQFNVREFLQDIERSEMLKAEEFGYEAEDLRRQADRLDDLAADHQQRVDQIKAALAYVDPKIEQEIVQRISQITITPTAQMQELLNQSKGLPFGSMLAEINRQYQGLASMQLLEVVTTDLTTRILP